MRPYLYSLAYWALTGVVAGPTTVYDHRHIPRDASTAAAATNTVPASIGSFEETGTIQSTNETSQFNNILSLRIIGNESSLRIATDVAALTVTTGRSIIKSGSYEGLCVGKLIMAKTGKYIAYPDIALISCDDEETAMDLTVQSASQNSDCILLYSLNSTSCNISSSNNIYSSQLGFVMTFLSRTVAQSVISNVEAGEEGDFTAVAQTMTLTSAAAGSDGDSSTSSKTSGSTLAMAVLYAITGIIAFMFLFIIISGAIRIHSHPERYGLPPTGGDQTETDNTQYTNMNRAKGIARAVLDSIPLVTVRVRPKATSSNAKEIKELELSTIECSGSKHVDQLQKVTSLPNSTSTASETLGEGAADNGITTTSSLPATEPLEISDDDDLTCPICFDDFQDGQILRILPCKHRFHALCVDPWLLNSSTHCPMCRVDLSISQEEAVPDHPPGSPTSDRIVIPEGYDVETSLFNRFLDVWNAHLLPRDARRAALARFEEEAALRRQLREARSSHNMRHSIFRQSSAPEHLSQRPPNAPAEPEVERVAEDEQQNQNLWLRFVASRRILHQIRRQSLTPTITPATAATNSAQQTNLVRSSSSGSSSLSITVEDNNTHANAVQLRNA